MINKESRKSLGLTAIEIAVLGLFFFLRDGKPQLLFFLYNNGSSNFLKGSKSKKVGETAGILVIIHHKHEMANHDNLFFPKWVQQLFERGKGKIGEIFDKLVVNYQKQEMANHNNYSSKNGSSNFLKRIKAK